MDNMTLEQAIKMVRNGIILSTDPEFYNNDDAAISLVLSAAEKWDAIEWASQYEESMCEECPMSIHHSGAEKYCECACCVLAGHRIEEPLLSAYRAAQEGKE